MNLSTLLENIGTALREDTALIAWIDEKYGGTMKIYSGIDQRDPPGQDDAPLIVLFPEGKTGGIRSEEKDHLIRIRPEILNAGSTTTTDGYGAWVKYTGISEIVAFTRLVVDVIYSNLPTIFTDDPGFVSFETSLETVEYFPIFFADIMATFSAIRHTRSEPYA